jgi:hypothetical protein
MMIVDTIVPWTAEWLLHYEVWLTGLGPFQSGLAGCQAPVDMRHRGFT